MRGKNEGIRMRGKNEGIVRKYKRMWKRYE